MKFERMLYLMVHVVAPLIFFVSYMAWGSIGLSKGIWENVTDNLSILGIYYIGVSVLWFTNLDAIKKTSEKMNNRNEIRN